MILYCNDINGFGMVFSDDDVVRIEEIDNERTRLWFRHGGSFDGDVNFEQMTRRLFAYTQIIYLTSNDCGAPK